MVRAARFLAGSLFAAAFMLDAAIPNHAMAQATPASAAGSATEARWEPSQTVYEDGNICVQEVRFRPGDQGANIRRPFRVVRVLEGGTLERAYPDGRTETVEFRTGEVKVLEAESPYIPRNVGKTDVVLFVVALTEPH